MKESLEHIAFILDGNRRWAKKHNLPLFMGHKRGYEVAKEVSQYIGSYGIKYVSYYVFSLENWKRSGEEVGYLMDLFRDMFDETNSFFQKNKARIIAIGNLAALPLDILKKIKKIEEETKNNSELTITIAISYSGREEILRAAKKLAYDAISGKIEVDDVTEDIFCEYLDTKGIPYPDILVRSGEKRISNFLIWQIAYSEIFFIDKLWPEFEENDLKSILEEFSKRTRRYGR